MCAFLRIANTKNTFNSKVYILFPLIGLYPLLFYIFDRDLIDVFQRHTSTFHILQSAILKAIVGFNYKSDQWSAFANNAIEHHSAY